MYTLSLDISSFMIPLDQCTVVIFKASAITTYYHYTTILPLPYRLCLSVYLCHDQSTNSFLRKVFK